MERRAIDRDTRLPSRLHVHYGSTRVLVQKLISLMTLWLRHSGVRLRVQGPIGRGRSTAIEPGAIERPPRWGEEILEQRRQNGRQDLPHCDLVLLTPINRRRRLQAVTTRRMMNSCKQQPLNKKLPWRPHTSIFSPVKPRFAQSQPCSR